MRRERQDYDEACTVCGFELWEPIAASAHSKLGLYNDSRFPGRCILSLVIHEESMESLSMDTLMEFMRDAQVAMKAIKRATGAARVNFSVLGNREPHVHAHLIPRFPENEEFPDCSPWNDQRPKEKLPKQEVERLKGAIVSYLTLSSEEAQENG